MSTLTEALRALGEKPHMSADEHHELDRTVCRELHEAWRVAKARLVGPWTDNYKKRRAALQDAYNAIDALRNVVDEEHCEVDNCQDASNH